MLTEGSGHFLSDIFHGSLDGFCPKILGPWWEPTKVFCGYVNGHWVGILVQGGGDRHPLYVIIEHFSGNGGGGLKT